MIRNQKEALLQRKKDRNPQFSGQGMDTTAMEAAPMAQLKAGPGGMSAGAGASAQLKSSSTSNWFPESGGALSAEPQVKGSFQPSGGSSIPEETLGKMETSFGSDFGGVKVVENSQQAQQMNAQAFAQGEELHFAPGKFRPGTESGDELLGHELAHVEQQRKGKVKPTTEVDGTPVNDDQSKELEADQQGRRAARGQQAGVGGSQFGASAGAVQAKMNPTPFSPVQRKEEEGEGETTQLKQVPEGPVMAPPPAQGVAQRKVAQLAGNAPAATGGMPETVVDISQGFDPPQDVADYLDKNKTKYNKVKVRWGDLGTGVLEVRQETKGTEGAPGKYKVKEGGYIDYKKIDFLNALEGAGLTPCIVLKGTDPESLSGFLSVRKGEQVLKDNIIEIVNKNMETLRLLGMTKLTGTAHNTFTEGVLSMKAEGLSTQVGGFMNATGGFGIEGDRFVFNLSGDVDIAGLAHAVLDIERNAEGQIRGEADIDVSVANLDGNVKIVYADGTITGRGTASMASEKFSGSVTLVFDEEAAANAAVHSGLGVETIGETAAPEVGGGAQGKRVLVGFGSLTLHLTDWMTATANVGIDSEGHVTVHGQIKFPDSVQLMEQKDKQKDLFDVEIKAGYGVPLVGQIFLFASIGMFVKAGFGPLVLRDIGMEGTYSTDPNIAQNFSITGALAISAYAMAGLRARAGVGLTLLGHDIKAGIQCDASAGVKAYAEARPTFEYRENGPGQKGEAHLKGHFEAAAQLFLELAGAFFVELDSPWWSPAPDKTWEWPFGSVQYPIGSSDFGIGADVDWLVGSPDVPEVQFSPVEFDPNKFISDMTKEPDNFGEKGKKGGEQNPAGKWQDGGGGGNLTADPKHTGGGGGNIAAESPNLKNLPDDQKFMRALDDCGKMAKTAQTKPAPQGVVEKRLQEIKDRYGINQITLKNKKGEVARIYVQHTNQNNAKNMIEVKMMSEAERQRLFNKAKKDMEALLKQMGEKETGAINKSQAETAGKQVDEKHDVIISTEVKDAGQTWKVMGDIEDKQQELGSGVKKEGGEGEGQGAEGGETEVRSEADLTPADRRLNESVADQFKKEIQSENNGLEFDNFDEFYYHIKQKAEALVPKYLKKIRKGLDISIDFTQLQQDKKDGDLDFKIRIFPNDTIVMGEVEYENPDLQLPESLLLKDCIEFKSGLNKDVVWEIHKIPEGIKDKVVILNDKAGEKQPLNYSLQQFHVGFNSGQIIEVAPNNDGEIWDKANQLKTEIESIVVVISGPASMDRITDKRPDRPSDMVARYRKLFDEWTFLSTLISGRSHAEPASILAQAKEMKKKVLVLKSSLEQRIQLEGKENIGLLPNSNMAFGYYSLKVRLANGEWQPIRDSFSSTSSKFRPEDRLEDSRGGKVKLMDPVGGGFDKIFPPARDNGNGAPQDAERKVVSFLYGTVFNMIKTGIRSALKNKIDVNLANEGSISDEDILTRMKTEVTGLVILNTEMSPCTACDRAISRLRSFFDPSNVTVKMNYGVIYEESHEHEH